MFEIWIGFPIIVVLFLDFDVIFNNIRKFLRWHLELSNFVTPYLAIVTFLYFIWKLISFFAGTRICRSQKHCCQGKKLLQAFLVLHPTTTTSAVTTTTTALDKQIMSFFLWITPQGYFLASFWPLRTAEPWFVFFRQQ